MVAKSGFPRNRDGEVNFDGAFQRFFPDIEEVCRRVCRRQSRLRPGRSSSWLEIATLKPMVKHHTTSLEFSSLQCNWEKNGRREETR